MKTTDKQSKEPATRVCHNTFAMQQQKRVCRPGLRSLCMYSCPRPTSFLLLLHSILLLLLPTTVVNCDDRLTAARSARSAAINYADYSLPMQSSSSSSSSSSPLAAVAQSISGGAVRYAPQQFLNSEHNNNNDNNNNNSSNSNKFSRSPSSAYIDVSDLQSYNLIAGAREDICKHCLCENVNKFRTVHCDYRKNYTLSPTFGANFVIPTSVTSISIRLGSKTKFVLQDGLFHKNIVNSFTIEGQNADDQVELAKNAFHGNQGGYPIIKVHNVRTVFVRQGAFSAGEIKFRVQNCDELTLFTDAFTNVNMTGIFVGIRDMSIHEKAFNSAHARLRIENSAIAEITRFEASVHEIRFINCRIGVIRRFTFDVTNINFIVFENCQIETIETRAITDKLHSDHVSITNAVIGVIDSEAIYGSGISELVLTNNTITSINDKAISVHSVNVTIALNEIKHLGNNWLTVKDWAKIVVEQNKFGRFGNMSLQLPQQPADCSFSSNSLTEPQPGSLNISNCRIHEVSVNLPCTCNLTWLQSLSDHDLRSETYCSIDHNLKYCFNATSFNTLKYVNEVCDESKKILNCVANRKIKKVNGYFFTPEELEQRNKRFPLYISIITIGGLLAVALLSITLLCCLCRRDGRGHGGVGGNGAAKGNNSTLENGEPNEHLHDFTLEDRRVIHHTMQMLQKKYPEIYKPVNERTKQLLQPDLSEKKCVKAITQIVTLLGRVQQQPADDFVPFNQMLTQHLQLRLPSAPPADPIYTEPGLVGMDVSGIGLPAHCALADGGDYYTSSTIIMGNAMEHPNSGTGRGLAAGAGAGNAAAGGAAAVPVCDLTPEHIYAEPSCAQQPLLRNEYASPADRHMEAMDVYTEPINERDAINMPPAYEATATILPQQHLQPHYPQSLPRLPQYATPKRNAAHAQLAAHSSGSSSSSSNNNNSQSNNLPTMRAYKATPTAAAALPMSAFNTQQQQQQQRRQRNLPDVLYQMHGHGNGNGNGNDDDDDNSSQAAAAARGTHQTNVRRLAKDLEAMPKFHPNQLSSAQNQRHLHLYTTPHAAHAAAGGPSTSSRLASNAAAAAAAHGTSTSGGGKRHKRLFVTDMDAVDAGEACELDLRGAAALPPDSGSDHSGGSDETIKIDDIIEYADA